MEENSTSSTSTNERRSLALSALIMSLVALFCAFITGWRMFSLAVAGAAFVVSIFVLTKVRHRGPSKRLSIAALGLALVTTALELPGMLAAARGDHLAASAYR